MAPPLLWLLLLQTNYVLAYPSCGARSNHWLHIANAVALGGMLLLGVGALHVWRTDPPRLREGRARPEEQQDPIGETPSLASRHLVSLLGIFMTLLFLVMVIGTAIPPLILYPCD
jgi:hypothetical protein